MTERITAADFRAQSTTRERREDTLHLSILEYLRFVLPDAVINHSPNEAQIKLQSWWPAQVKADVRRSIAIYQARNGKMGTRKGWPDIEVIHRGQFMAFEVKAEGGKTTPEQEAVGADIIRAGGRWALVRSLDDVEECLNEWRADLVEVELRGQIT